MKVPTFTALCSIFVISLLFLPALQAATRSHTYDNLNRLIQTVYENGAKIATLTYAYDGTGNLLIAQVTTNYLLGDVDGNQLVNLTDAILCLRVVSGQTTPISLRNAADIDGDGMIGMPETLYILKAVTETD